MKSMYIVLCICMSIGCAAEKEDHIEKADRYLQEIRQKMDRIEADHETSKPLPTVATYEAYEKVQPLYTYERVKSVAGLSDGELTSELDLSGSKFETYAWRNPNGSMLTITFKDGRVDYKHQSGLR